MNTLKNTISIAAIGAIAIANCSADDSSFYVGGSIPIQFGSDSTFVSTADSPLFENVPNANSLDILDDLGSGLNVQFGYDFGKFRAELDFSQNRTNTDEISLLESGSNEVTSLSYIDGYTRNSSAMLNAFYDYSLNEKWEIYAGVGVGFAKTRGVIQANSGEESIEINYTGKNEFSYQALIGVSYKATDKIDLTFGYRRVFAKEVSFEGGTLDISHPEALEAGIRFNF